MKVTKAVLYRNMDGMACSMDCRDKLYAIRRIADLAATDIEKSLEFARQNNRELEGQLKLEIKNALQKESA